MISTAIRETITSFFKNAGGAMEAYILVVLLSFSPQHPPNHVQVDELTNVQACQQASRQLGARLRQNLVEAWCLSRS
jgi:hypothetical protein